MITTARVAAATSGMRAAAGGRLQIHRKTRIERQWPDDLRAALSVNLERQDA